MRIIVIIYILLIASSALAGTFRDDFEDGNFDGWEVFDHGPISQWRVKEGKLMGIHPGGMWRGSWMLWGEEKYRDYTIEFEAQVVRPIWGNNFVIAGIARFTANGFVYFGIGSFDNKAFIGLWDLQPDQFMNEKNIPYLCDSAKLYHFRADIASKTVKLIVDDKFVMEYEHPSIFKNGRIGVALIGAEVHFDNVAVTGDDIPDIGPRGFAVASMGKLATTWGQIRSR